MSEREDRRWGEGTRSDALDARRRILDAALFCYSRFGLRKTRVVDVALQARITRMTIYRYYRDAAEMSRAALRRTMGDIWCIAMKEVGSAGSALTNLCLLVIQRIEQNTWMLAPEVLHLMGEIAMEGYGETALQQFCALVGSEKSGCVGNAAAFEIANRVVISYLLRPSPFFSKPEELSYFFERNHTPMILALCSAEEAETSETELCISSK